MKKLSILVLDAYTKKCRNTFLEYDMKLAGTLYSDMLHSVKPCSLKTNIVNIIDDEYQKIYQNTMEFLGQDHHYL